MNTGLKWIIRSVVAGGLIVAVSGISYLGYLVLSQPFQARAAAKPETVTVKRGDITATVSVSGSVSPQEQINVAFKTGGRVAKVYVKEGDAVRKGDLLVTLDSTDIETQIAQAESALRIAQINLQKAQKPISKDQLTIAKVALEKARINLQKAQAEYDKIAWRSDAGLYPQAANLQMATLDYQSAEANYNIQTRGATKEDLALLEEQVKQAEANLATAKRNLDNVRLTAPRDGMVLTVNVKETEFASAQPAVVLVDNSCLQVRVDVDETEIGRVVVGQQVIFTLDAFGDQEIAGRVKEIALSPTVSQGVVNYKVTIALDPCALPIRIGMTANASIVVAQKQDVLLIPNRAIRRRSGQKQVQVWRNGAADWVNIETGLTNDQETEVVSGLKEGDEVVTRVTATNNPLNFGFGQ